jgi:hypothetical protein
MATPRTLAGVRVSEARGRGRISASRRAGFRAAIVAVAPVVLVVGFVSHPYIGVGPPDDAAVAVAAAAYTTRWGISHLIVALGSGLLALAFLAIRSYLRDAGEERWSAPALPLIVIASTLYAVLPGMEFAALAAAETGADVRAAQAAVQPWFIPVILISGVTFAVGVFRFARGISSIGLSTPRLTRLVVGGLAVMAVARMVPLTGMQLYVQAVALLVALGPLAFEIWRRPEVEPARQ